MAKNKSAKKSKPDPVAAKIALIFKASGMNTQQLGEAMGYDASTARKSVFQFLRTLDPRISTLRRFAKATKTPIEKLVK